MSIYVPPSIRHFEPKRLVFSTWFDHVPFAYDLVAELRPRTLVELGTHNGMSYFAFCQSIKDHDIDSICYAVDTWAGEEHSGEYGNDVFDSVSYHNREHYAGFSYLMRMLFEEAVNHFDDGTIDLLHIDGLHTYEAVAADFATWYPKVRPGGVILFHDVQSRMMDFGVWRFWDEIRDQHDTFTFTHGYGLGVLRKPGGAEPTTALMQALFGGDDAEHERLRAFYVYAARYITLNERARSGAMKPIVGPRPKAESST